MMEADDELREYALRVSDTICRLAAASIGIIMVAIAGLIKINLM